MRSATKRKVGKDPAYLAWLHTQPCAIAGIGFPCSGPIHAHHAGLRGLSQKAHDHTAIPLCEGHHLTGRDSHRVLGKRFYDYHEIELQEIIAALNAAFEQQVRRVA